MAAPTQIQDNRFSFSVNRAINSISNPEYFTAWEFVKEILILHPEYGKGLGGKISNLPPTGGNKQSAAEWLDQLCQLIDVSKIRDGVIHGRLAIIGLCRLDNDLGTFLKQEGLTRAIEMDKEISQSFEFFLKAEPNTPGASEQTSPDSKPKTPNYEPAPRYSAGISPDAVNPNAKDLLGIEREVANFATILCSKKVSAPISIGLFGDWGSGKSFFIGKLRKEIEYLTGVFRSHEKNENKVSPDWCTHMVHVEFNAWHFSDANLWASIVSEIYEELFKSFSVDSDTKLKEELEKRRQIKFDAEFSHSEAKKDLEKAKESLKLSVAEKKELEGNLFERIKNLIRGVEIEEEDKTKIKNALKTLELPGNLVTNFEQLQKVNEDLQKFRQRSSVLFVRLSTTPRMVLVIIVLSFVIPIVVPQLLDVFGDKITAISKQIATVNTLVTSLLAWLQLNLRRGLNALSTIEDVTKKAQDKYDEDLKKSPEYKELHENLIAAQIKEQAAREHLIQAETKLKDLENQIANTKPEKALYSLIERRAQSDTYNKHLGIISLIRRDFEQISDFLLKIREEYKDASEEPPIQRIVLYIDDLDRCRPERVVEVLEAIHLLLAFPLFIVVVGVDPRWLRHSLQDRYPQTLLPDLQKNVTDEFEETIYATPQDYLEKIFQIPFALRPVEKKGFKQLIDVLLKPEYGSISAAPALANVKPGVETPPEVNKNSGDQASENNGEIGIATSSEQEHHISLPVARHLEFETWEQKDIERLWRFFQTPRTIKRFINVYRMLRASISTEEELKQFAGTDTSKGEYQMIVILLAMVTNFPNINSPMLDFLEDWLEERKHDKDKEQTWNDVHKQMELKYGSSARNNAYKQEWEEMINQLKETINELEPVSFNIGRFNYWLTQAGRYSFSIKQLKVRQMQ